MKFKINDKVKLIKMHSTWERGECNPLYKKTKIVGAIKDIHIIHAIWDKPFEKCEYDITVEWDNGTKNEYPEDALEKIDIG